MLKRYTELRSLTLDPNNADNKPAPQDDMEQVVDPASTTATPSTEADLKDPNKFCELCAASFNNPQMALQHYNGRKHQRNQARQKLMNKLGDDVQQGNTGSCLTAKQYKSEGIRLCKSHCGIKPYDCCRFILISS